MKFMATLVIDGGKPFMKHSLRRFTATLTAAATALAVVGLATFNEKVVPPAQAETISTSGTYTSGPDTGDPWEVTSLYTGNTISPEGFTWYLGPTQPLKTQELALKAIAAQAAGSSAASSTQYTVYILRGDTMTWTGGVSSAQSIASGYFGPWTPGLPGIWAPDSSLGFYGFNANAGGYFYGVDELNPKNMENITIDDPDPTHIPVCPDSTPTVGRTHPTVLWDGWCWGILEITATIDSSKENVIPPTVDMVIPGKTWTYGSLPSLAQNVYDPALGGATTWGGPNNPARGDNVEGYGVLSILDPKLEVKKQVCTSYDTQGNPTCTNDSSNGWVDDGTYGDGMSPDDHPGSGVTGGVESGVESGQVPPGTTNLMWRITASNAGNVPLTGIHVAADATTLYPVISDPVDTTNVDTCSGMKFTSTYDSSGNPRIDVLHDFARYAGDEAFDDPGVLMPGNQISKTCTTVMDHAFTGTVQNTVGLNALFDDPDDPIFQPPEGFEWNDDGTVLLGGPLNNQLVYPDAQSALMYRFTGYNGEVGQVPSNTDSAQVTIPNPMIKLTKWVCNLYDDNKQPICDMNAIPDGSQWLTQLAGIGEMQDDGTIVVTKNDDDTIPTRPGTAPEGSGWVKAADGVPYEGAGLWLLVVTNIGNTAVTGINFNTEYVTGKAGLSDNWVHVPQSDPDVLGPGHSATYTVLTHAIVDTGSSGDYAPNDADATNFCQEYAEKLITGVDGDVTQHCVDYTTYGERPYIAGDDLTNTAVATAIPSDDDGTPLVDSDDKPLAPVISNPSTAEANTTTPTGALKVTKWVCSIGTGCSYDLTHEQLQQLTGVNLIVGGEGKLNVAQGQSVSGVTADGVEWSWLPETIVAYNTDADWLIVATNIGDVSLVNVGIRDSISSTGHGDMELSPTYIVDETTPNRVNTSTRVLASGNSVAWAASTSAITSRDDNDPGYNATSANANTPWFEPDRKSGTDSVVNTASATGTAWDVVNDKALQSSPGINWTVRSNTSSAEVNSIALAIGDWVWFDSNEDGLQGDNPENAVSGIQGVQVDLLHADGTPVTDSNGDPMTTTTDSEGFYYFDMLAPGTYRVAFHLPAGYAWTTPWAKTGGRDEDPTYVYVARDSNAAFAYTSPASVASLTNDSPASDDPIDLIRVTRAFEMNVPTLLDYDKYDYVFPTSQADIPERYRTTLKADFINPTIDAGITYPNPELKITKWVCERYDELNQPDCADPYSINPDSGKYVWDDLNGYTAEKHELYAGVPSGGWVKEATIPAGSTAQWLIVVTNVGGTRLANVTIEDALESLPANPAEGRGATGIATIYSPDAGLTDDTSIPLLEMTGTRVFMMTTENITNQNETVSGIKYDVDDENNDAKNRIVGEPTYDDGTDDVINSVYAQGDPVDQAGAPVMGSDGVTPLPPETSNNSTAEVNSIGFAIGDYVWIDEDKNGQQDPEELPVKGMHVSLYAIVGGVQSQTPWTTTTDDDGFYLFDNLPAGSYQVVFTLPTGYVWTSLREHGVGAAFDSDADRTTGRSEVIVLGLNEDGTPMDGVQLSSDMGYAVNATWINPTIDAGIRLPEPGLKLTKWVCSDFVNGCLEPQDVDLAAMAGFDSDGVKAGVGKLGWVKETTAPDETTQVDWLIVVTNTGPHGIDNVTLSDEYSKGVGAAPVTCDAPTVRLAPGESHIYHCTTAWVTNTQPFVTGLEVDEDGNELAVDPVTAEPAYSSGEDVVNAAQASGTPLDDDGVPIPLVDDEGNPVLDDDDQPVPSVTESNVSDAEVNVVGYAVGDYVWIDDNDNGIQDLNEQGVEGVNVVLRNAADGSAVATTTTDSNGWYHFDLLNSGSYYVEFQAKDGYVWGKLAQGDDARFDSDAAYTLATDAVAASEPFTLTSKGTNVVPTAQAPAAYRDDIKAAYINPTIDAGLVEANPAIDLKKYVCSTGTNCVVPDTLTSLDPPDGWVKSATVKYDTDADWLVIIENTGNVPLQDVTLTEENFNAGSLRGFTPNDCVAEQVTDLLEPGAFVPWTCTVNHVVNTEELGSKQDIVNTAQAEGTGLNNNRQPLRNPDDTPKKVTTDEDIAEVNTEAYAVGDYVWFDADGDGVQGDEEGLEGVTVRLLDHLGNPVPGVADVKTDSQGYYWFDLLLSGDYMVEFTLPDGYMWTTTNVRGSTADNGSDAVFTDPVQATARSAVFTLGEGAPGLVASTTAPEDYASHLVALEINPTIDAGVIEMVPGIELQKYVCSKGTGCTDPATMTYEEPASDWVKATTVKYGTNADWVILVKNTGNVALGNVDLSREDFSAGGAGFNGNCKPAAPYSRLEAGESIYFSCTINNVTNTAEWGSGKDIVNTAQASGTPVDKTGRPVGKTPGPVFSNTDTAEVNSTAKPAVATGGTGQPPYQNGWVIPLCLMASIIGVGVVITRRRFN